MKRLFLSAPTTCALLLGAGLLLRAQAALKSDDRNDARVRVLKDSATRALPSEMDESPATLPAGRGKQASGSKAIEMVRDEQRSSQSGNAVTPRARAARLPKRRAGGRKVVFPRWGVGAGSTGDGGRQ